MSEQYISQLFLRRLAVAQNPLGRLWLYFHFQHQRMRAESLAHGAIVGKRAFDIVVSFIVLLLLAPVFMLIGFFIWLEDGGGVFFAQTRVGEFGRQFKMYKFRSMCLDAEQRLKDLLAKNHHREGVTFKLKADPRITRVGKWLRKFSLDELPQFYNVLIGDMSLVGPRPHAIHAKAENRLYDEAVDGYFARHRVKPGITGWAQVNGWRGETDTHEKIQRRVEHDLHYIENWSVLFDLYILALTPLALAKTTNAY